MPKLASNTLMLYYTGTFQRHVDATQSNVQADVGYNLLVSERPVLRVHLLNRVLVPSIAEVAFCK